MSNIIDLNEFFIKSKENASNHHVYFDDEGASWYEYSYEFDHDGKKYGYGIWARSLEDAEAMLKNMGNGKITGVIYSEIPAGDNNDR